MNAIDWLPLGPPVWLEVFLDILIALVMLASGLVTIGILVSAMRR